MKKPNESIEALRYNVYEIETLANDDTPENAKKYHEVCYELRQRLDELERLLTHETEPCHDLS